MFQNNSRENSQARSRNNVYGNVDNMLRSLTMLEKALDRLLRQNYFSQNQYPEIVKDVEAYLNALRSWIQEYKIFANVPYFIFLSGSAISTLGYVIAELIDICKAVNGKKIRKKKQRIRDQEGLCKTIETIFSRLVQYLANSHTNANLVLHAFEKALLKAFTDHFMKRHTKLIKILVSSRGEKSYIFPCSNQEEYKRLVNDKKRFRAEVVSKLSEYIHATGHKPSCVGPKKYRLCGFRQDPRKPVVVGGHQEEFPIRMVQCLNCGQKFSLLPSFLPREKHFTIDLIGRAVQNIVLFNQSIQAVLENIQIGNIKIKSKQTILNWLRWLGTLHPASVLTRGGVVGSGYLQEDEGFEKEPNLRTYTVFMRDPKNLLVWHADYVDHVDEETLSASFENFMEKIDFKILGVTKDRWKASTTALKNIFYGIWIGFCHRHCLKKFYQALLKYQAQNKCSQKKIAALYKQFKEVLQKSTSELSLKINLKFLRDEAFNHPLLRERLDELEENAVHYTANRRRQGITKTTSIVDNFLKIVKRKLTMAESFRDKECAKLLFRAMGNVRNFVPFLPGAKYAYKSPFILAEGQTYNLPWMQVMNMHNAFLFTKNAF